MVIAASVPSVFVSSHAESATIRKSSSVESASSARSYTSDLPPQGTHYRNLQDIELTGLDSIIFRSCETLSVATSSDNSGNIVNGVKSFVEFDVCESKYCYSNLESARTTYVTSLTDYVLALSEFLPTKQQEYCEGCLQNYDYCIPATQSTERNQNRKRYTDGARSLAGDVVYETIDCQRCVSYGCMHGNNKYYQNQQQWTQKQSLEWIQSMATCHQDSDNSITVNGQQVSFGFMCNQEGTGVEIAAFLDNECTVYTNQIAYSKVMSSFESLMWWKSKANVEYIFNTDFSCYDPEVTYVVPDYNQGGQNGAGNNNNNNGGNDAQPEAGEWCTNLFAASEMAPVSMTDCGVAYDLMTYGDQSNSSSSTTETLANNYYTLLSLEDAQNNGTAVCTKLYSNGGTGEHIYSNSASGKLYRYNSARTSTTSSFAATSSSSSNNQENPNWLNTLDEMAKQFTSNKSVDHSAWLYGLICVATIVALAGTVLVGKVFRGSSASAPADNEQPILSAAEVEGGDARQRPTTVYQRFRSKLILS